MKVQKMTTTVCMASGWTMVVGKDAGFLRFVQLEASIDYPDELKVEGASDILFVRLIK